MPTKEDCEKKNKVLNPSTNRCVGKDTKKGKELLAGKGGSPVRGRKASKSPRKSPRKRSKSRGRSRGRKRSVSPDCEKLGKVYNPASGKCVGKNTKKGKELLAGKSKSPSRSPKKRTPSPKKSPKKSTGCILPNKCSISKDYTAADIQKIAEECGINIYKKEGSKAKKSRKDLCDEISKVVKKSPGKLPKKSPKKSPKRSSSKSPKRSPSPKKSPKKASPKSTRITKEVLGKMTIKAMQEFAKSQGIKGYSGKKKQDLIDHIYNNLPKTPKGKTPKVKTPKGKSPSPKKSPKKSRTPSPKRSPSPKRVSPKKTKISEELDDFFNDELVIDETSPAEIVASVEEINEEPEEEISWEPSVEEPNEEEIPEKVPTPKQSPKKPSPPKRDAKKEIRKMRDELKSRGIFLKKDVSEQELEEIMGSDCDADNYNCSEGKSCYVNDSGKGKCIPSGKGSSLKGSPIKEYTHKGKTYIGSDEAIKNLKSRLEPMPEKTIPKEDIEDLLREIKEPTEDTQSLARVRENLYKCLGLISE
jgi:hypothetical protein